MTSKDQHDLDQKGSLYVTDFTRSIHIV